MLPEEKDVVESGEIATSDVDNNENNTASAVTIEKTPQKRMVTEEDFDEIFEEVKLTPALQADLYRKSIVGFVGFLIRAFIIFTISGALFILGFTSDGFDKQVPFMMLAVMTIAFCSFNDMIMQYPYDDVKWYAGKDVQKAYLVLATGKGKSRKKKTMLLELEHQYIVKINNPSTYSSIDKGEPVLLLVKNDNFRAIGIDTLLGTQNNGSSLRGILK